MKFGILSGAPHLTAIIREINAVQKSMMSAGSYLNWQERMPSDFPIPSYWKLTPQLKIYGGKP